MQTKLFLAFIGLLLLTVRAEAQKIQEIVSKEIDDAIPVFDQLLGSRSFADIKVLGLGDAAVFVKESKKLATSFSAYLISRQKFRNIVLHVDDWQVRPLNAYLTSAVRADTLVLDSLIKSIFSSDYQFRNRDFRAFLQWLKQYNLTNPKDQVNFGGVAPVNRIPPAYFLAAYVFEIDKTYGQQLSEKWSNEDTSDSLAYSDIDVWLQAVRKTKSSTSVRQQILRCEGDLQHNKYVLKYNSPDQQFSQNQLNDKARYTANQVLQKSDKPTIFYAMTYQVMKGELETSVELNGLPVSAVGKYLKDELKSSYQSFAIDFADSAKVMVIDIPNRKGDLEKVNGTAQAKALYQKGEFIDRTKDAQSLKGYKPTMLWPYKGQVGNLILGKEEYAIDAVFLFSSLTELDLSEY
ncbi:MAG: hypothetical protein EOO88_03895 [Pedobacter sp.]|nr:MAG: hypothetical protein EOO88_03895 [Pedobacter sp.]